MPEIPYSRFEQYLADTPPSDLAQAWLIHGEEAFCKAAAGRLVDRLLPGPARNLGYDAVENDDVFAAIQRASTFSLFAETRVIALPDSRVFYTRDDHQSLLKKAREAAEDDQMPKAARHAAAAMGLLGLSLADAAVLSPDRKGVKIDPEIWEDGLWFKALVDYCQDQGIAPTPPADRADELQKAVAAGFPAHTHLLITTDLVDKRRGLYKTLLKSGGVVNCSVPAGAGRQDTMARDALLAEHARAILSRHKKQMAPDAFRMMTEMTGFDLRTLSANLEKLIQFVGDAPAITAADVTAVLRRTKQDPIYELTGALSERDAAGALFFLDSLLGDGLVPLQILAAVINVMRRMLVAKGFVIGASGQAWQRGMRYNDFQRSVLPAIQAHDEALLASLGQWETSSEAEGDAEDGAKAAGSPARPKTDLLMAPRGKNAYPIYLLFKNAARFRFIELIEIMEDLQRTDVALKTSGGAPRRLLESIVIRICRGR